MNFLIAASMPHSKLITISYLLIIFFMYVLFNLPLKWGMKTQTHCSPCWLGVLCISSGTDIAISHQENWDPNLLACRHKCSDVAKKHFGMQMQIYADETTDCINVITLYFTSGISINIPLEQMPLTVWSSFLCTAILEKKWYVSGSCRVKAHGRPQHIKDNALVMTHLHLI